MRLRQWLNRATRFPGVVISVRFVPSRVPRISGLMETIYNRGINLGYRENKSDRQIVLMTRRNAPCGGRSLSGFAFLFQQLTPGVRSVYFDSTTAGEIAVSDTIPRMSQMRENSDAFGLGFCARVIALRLEFVSCADSRTRRRSKLRLLSAQMKHPRSRRTHIFTAIRWSRWSTRVAF